MKRMSTGEVISSVVFGGAGAAFWVAALDPARSWPERCLLAACGLVTGCAAFRFPLAAWLARWR